MEKDFTITIGDDNLPIQSFNGKVYKLYPNRRYFMQHKHHMHHKVWEFYNGKRKKGYHIHHINGNAWDNRIENLEEIEAFKHLSEHIKNRWEENPQLFKKFQEAGVESAKEWHSSPEGIEWHKEHGKKSWENRKYRKLICQMCGKEYETRHGGESKYCHLNCKAKATRLRKKLNEENLTNHNIINTL